MNKVAAIVAAFLMMGGVITGCFESEKVRVVRIHVSGAEMQKGNGFQYFDVSFFETGIGTDFSDIKISDIISVGYQIWAVNDDTEAASFRFFASQTDAGDFMRADSVIALTALVFAPPAVPPATSYTYEWPESMGFAVNQDRLKEYLRQRSATYYLISDSPLLYLDSVSVIITAKIFNQ